MYVCVLEDTGYLPVLTLHLAFCGGTRLAGMEKRYDWTPYRMLHTVGIVNCTAAGC